MNTSNPGKKNIRVEGWRGISHSYALVNQFQLLNWKKNNLADIQHIDMPFVMAHWSAGQNSAGFNEQDIQTIEKITTTETAQALYRIFAPFSLDTPVNLPTVTFAVTELGLNAGDCEPSQVLRYATNGGLIHTPSQWSKTRLVANGLPEQIIHVIPHAADSSYFFEMDALGIQQNRTTLGLCEDDIALLNVGTHHWNKGLDVLIKSFALARQKNPNLKLILKDQRSTYLMNSESYIHQILTEIGMLNQSTLDAIKIISGHLTLAQLNSLYNLADAYVTPYRAEGFNLPALEAQTCGTPVIATSGGATDDFLQPNTSRAISGILFANAALKDTMPVNAYIEPSLEDLTEILISTQRKFNKRNVAIQTDWSSSCRQLLSIFNL
jgi:glycosyltransferase involved in cell wall biosynthesis